MVNIFGNELRAMVFFFFVFFFVSFSLFILFSSFFFALPSTCEKFLSFSVLNNDAKFYRVAYLHVLLFSYEHVVNTFAIFNTCFFSLFSIFFLLLSFVV